MRVASDFPAGSSPLARGLPLGLGELVGGRRIIPARAGFTRPGARSSRTPGDHPRSRGVYDAAVPAPRVISGSSPLARGLRGLLRLCGSEGRIIPARAGFTFVPVMMTVSPADHPRSRGVYRQATGRRLQRRGSSPLARGLLHLLGGDRGEERIIPARAGFTAPGSRP